MDVDHFCIDLDFFKDINDTLGHSTGDKVLIEVGRRIKETAPSDALVARLGGDEFAILLDGIHRDDDAVTVAERLLSRFLEPLDMSGDKLRCSISIGIATSSVGGVENMLRNADVAMYYAKRGGRARYAVFNENMHEPQPETKGDETPVSARTAGQ